MLPQARTGNTGKENACEPDVPHLQGLVLLGITANHNTQGLKATALCRAARVFSTKKTRAAPALKTSFVLDLCREMPPPSERQKAAGYQNQGGIMQSSQGTKQKNEAAN